ncbi:glycosyltransferase family 4 protein [Coprobacillus cateniformis]|nr:glycosyltransferase family 4 protein [Coprobacillus cateniformis]
MQNFLKKNNYDLIHIWGTEYPHTLSVANIAHSLNIKTVISIQGIISDCSKHYNLGIPLIVQFGITLRDFIKKDNLLCQKYKFYLRGKWEKQSIKLSKDIIGRTIYDYSCVMEINKNINYHFCNECLREVFYEGKWDINCIERETIFISQASYPIKGFHYFLDALSIVKKNHPKIKVIVAGGFFPFKRTLKDKIRLSSYEKYIANKIIKLNLKENIKFIGNLNDEEMKIQLLKSNVFVSSSVIENSPNSVGEAMLIGTPVISSFVGGVSNMIDHGISGLLYPCDQPNILASYILEILNNDNFAIKLSKHAREKGFEIYDIKKNVDTIKNIYNTIINTSGDIYENSKKIIAENLL